MIAASVLRRGIPAAVAMTASSERVLFEDAFGQATTDSIFRVFSMTKPVTSVAALQLVERGLLDLDEPAANHLPALGSLALLRGFHPASGAPILEPARTPVTARHLLTHTSGFGYEFTSPALHRYSALTGQGAMRAVRKGELECPLLFEPGAEWLYGISTDWLGRLVEAVSGLSLADYFDAHILQPLGMIDTGFSLPSAKHPRVVVNHQRRPDGSLEPAPLPAPNVPWTYSGGGGLLSTASDYVRFMQMILRRGRRGHQQILRPESIDQMTSNQIGPLTAGRLQSTMPEFAMPADFHPGCGDNFGFGFLINPAAHSGGRSPGSLAWAGSANTYFWIDPSRGLCAVLLMQFSPFFDTQAVGLLRDFEQAVYR
ncbi:MAG: beta-lactamase family protein [Candidatus Solibacter usitatus]|nr:beta-lactamase family protein [Candidatus Solibacter usitatus]